MAQQQRLHSNLCWTWLFYQEQQYLLYLRQCPNYCQCFIQQNNPSTLSPIQTVGGLTYIHYQLSVHWELKKSSLFLSDIHFPQHYLLIPCIGYQFGALKLAKNKQLTCRYKWRSQCGAVNGITLLHERYWGKSLFDLQTSWKNGVWFADTFKKKWLTWPGEICILRMIRKWPAF